MAHIYRCRKHGQVNAAFGPRDYRLATGTSARCPHCGALLFYVGQATVTPQGGK